MEKDHGRRRVGNKYEGCCHGEGTSRPINCPCIFRVPVFFKLLDMLCDRLQVWGNRQQVLLNTGDSRLIYPPLPIILLSGDHVEIYVLGMDASGSNVRNGIQSTWSYLLIL